MKEDIEGALKAMAPFLVSELCRLGYPPSAPGRDDLLQEVRFRLWKALRDRGGEIKFLNAYVKTVVLSVFINEVERSARERRLIDAVRTAGMPLDATKSRLWKSKDLLRGALADALGSLGPAKRRTIELRLEGFSFEEIARLNHWSPGKARGCYYRGLAELRARLAERGIRYER